MGESIWNQKRRAEGWGLDGTGCGRLRVG